MGEHGLEFNVEGVGRERHGVSRVRALLKDHLGDEQRRLVVELAGVAEGHGREEVSIERLDGDERPVSRYRFTERTGDSARARRYPARAGPKVDY